MKAPKLAPILPLLFATSLATPPLARGSGHHEEPHAAPHAAPPASPPVSLAPPPSPASPPSSAPHESPAPPPSPASHASPAPPHESPPPHASPTPHPHTASPAPHASPEPSPSPPPAITDSEPGAEPTPALTISGVVDEPTLRGVRWLSPSRDLKRLAAVVACGAERSTVAFTTLPGGPLKVRELPGRLLAMSWVDGVRLALLTAKPEGITLELWNSETERGQFLDSLPTATGDDARPAARKGALAQECNPDEDGYALALDTSAGGATRLVLTLRRDATRFAVHRYALSRGPDGITISSRDVQLLAARGLRSVVPGPGAGPNLLIASDPEVLGASAGGGGPLRLALSSAGQPEQVLGHVGVQLTSCAFVTGGQLLCHARDGQDRGWLWLVRPERSGAARPRQLTYAGRAAAFAVSPDGFKVAYVGSGGPDGPLTILDLVTGARREAPRLPEASECASATTWPQVFWPDPERILARGTCGSSYAIVAADPPPSGTVAATSTPTTTEPTPATMLARSDAKHRSRGKAERSSKRSRPSRPQRAAAFWTPRF